MTLSEAIQALEKAGIESAAHDARELFAHFGNVAKNDLIFKNTEIPDSVISKPLSERIERRPLQYIIGEVGFYRESYIVNGACLIPREDTEILVDFAVKNIPSGAKLLDICTGSGCIAISSLKNTHETTATALDISEEALDVAKLNAERLGVSDRINFICENALTFKPKEKFFAILSNPPYVTEEEYLSLEKELYYEPKIALTAADDGLDFYKKIVPLVKDSLDDGGFIAFEIGKSQSDALIKIANENGMRAEILKDLSSNPRVAVLRSL